MSKPTDVFADPQSVAPEQDEAILRESGFTDVSLFHVGFTFRGWVAYATGRSSRP